LTSELVAESSELLNSGRLTSRYPKRVFYRLVTVGVSPKGINNLGVLVGLSGSSEKRQKLHEGCLPQRGEQSNLQKNPIEGRTSKGGG
jgi:hypothetical protein